jgi:hypothetical protein
MARPKEDTPPMVRAAFHVDPVILKRIDAERKRMRAKLPGLAVSRAAVLREALHRGLDLMEKSI